MPSFPFLDRYFTTSLSELGAPRNHHAIFVETNADSSGYMYQVTGNIQTGMAFGHRETEKPEDSPLFIEKSPIGTAAEGDYEKIREIVETIAPPGKQFDGPRRLDEKVPIRRCQEWTRDAIEALKKEGVLQP